MDDEELERAFERASRVVRDSLAHLQEISNLFMEQFRDEHPLDYFSLLPDRGAAFRACIFFEMTSDIAECEASGVSEEMRNFVCDKLEEFGRGKRGKIAVHFEFDSLENVTRDFEGNYFLRLR